MAIKIAPSNNPEKESKLFGIIALVCGVASLFVWIFAAAGLATGVRGVILSKRVNSKKYLTFSIVGSVLSLISLVYYFATS